MTSGGSRGSWGRVPRVLLVDPERDVLDTLGDIVVGWGYAPLLATTGQEALRLARVRAPRAVVSELLLRDLAPEDLLGELGRGAEADRPAFIALTSWCRLEDRLRAGRAGFDRFLAKPADLEELRRLLVDLTQERPPTARPQRPAAPSPFGALPGAVTRLAPEVRAADALDARGPQVTS